MTVFLLVDSDKNVVTIYSSPELAEKMKSSVEEKLNVKVTIEERTVDVDIKMIGITK